METILRYRIPGPREDNLGDKLAHKLRDNLGPEARIGDDSVLQDSGPLGPLAPATLPYMSGKWLPFLQNKVLLHLTTKNVDETTAVAPRSGRLPCNSLPVSHAIVFGGMVQWHGMAAAMNYVDFSGSGWSAIGRPFLARNNSRGGRA